MGHFRRRLLFATAGASVSAALSMSLSCVAPAYAQQARIYRVAVISPGSPEPAATDSSQVNPLRRAFADRMRDFGYVEGRNVVFDRRALEGRYDRIEEVVADVVRLKPDVILMFSQIMVERSLKVAAGVPIVMHASAAVVEMGLVRSLARPGGTITGLLVDVDVAVEAKRLELLRELLPKVRRVTFLGADVAWDHPTGKHVRAVAQRMGIDLSHPGNSVAEFDTAYERIARNLPEAVFVPTGPLSYVHREKIGQFVVANRIPCICAHSEIAEQGCLMSYGVNTIDLMRRTADYVAKILDGAKPGDLPIEQPTKFDLVINLKTAKSLGIKIPQAVLIRAERVIE